MTERDDEIEEFLTAYGSTLAHYDAEGTANHWGTPGTILADAFVGTLDSRAQMAEGLAQGYPLYRRLGLAGVRHTRGETEWLTDRIVRIRVRWHFLAEDDELLTDGDYEYLLRRDDDGQLRAYVAVAIDEAEKLAELVARKGIELPR
jgi:hypothetical protein